MADNIGSFTSSTAGISAVYATATGSNGVHGVTTSDADSAIYGEHGGNGVGVFGRGGHHRGEGVFGQTASPAAGLFGLNTANGPGVVGAGTYGSGVVGQSAHGYALEAKGNTTQDMTAGGWVKALIQVAAGTSPSILRTFSSQPLQQPFTVYRLDAGLYSIDFHFDVSGRYASATAVALNFVKDGSSSFPENPYAPLWYPPSSANTLQSNFVIANVVFDGLTGVPTPALGDPATRQPNKTMITVMTFAPVYNGAGGSFFVNGFKLVDATFTLAVF